MIEFYLHGYIIEIFNGAGYTSGSADNLNRYDKEYHSSTGNYQPASKHGIRVYSSLLPRQVAANAARKNTFKINLQNSRKCFYICSPNGKGISTLST
jgi:hypothetical protein